MARYITYPITTDPEDLIQDALDYMRAVIPGWEPAEGNLDVWMLEAVASLASELRDVASAVPAAIFRYFGNTLVALPPIDAAAATTTTTWTMVDAAGYTIDEGTVIGFRTAGDELIPFITLNSATVAPGDTVTGTGEITVAAINPGSDASGLGSASAAMELVDPLVFVDTIVMEASTTGGVDGETDEEYLDRLTTELRLLTPRPILPDDFAVLARRISGVDRSVAVDGYDVDHNLLTVNQSSLETNTTGWENDTNTSISRDSGSGLNGTASLLLTSSASGDEKARTLSGTSGVPVTPATAYTAMASFKTSATRNVRVGIRWYDSGGSLISTSDSGDFSPTSGVWTGYYFTAVSPYNAAFAAVLVTIKSTAAGAEAHNVDNISFKEGFSTVWKIGGSPKTGNERMITVVAIDESGQGVSSQLKSEIDAYLQSLREVNFIVHISDPNIASIDVDFEVVLYDLAFEGADPATVVAEAVAAVQAYLNPATWGRVPDGDPKEWINDPVVRYLEIAQIINNIRGVNYISALTLNLTGDTPATNDITIGGVAPLPSAGTITGASV